MTSSGVIRLNHSEAAIIWNALQEADISPKDRKRLELLSNKIRNILTTGYAPVKKARGEVGFPLSTYRGPVKRRRREYEEKVNLDLLLVREIGPVLRMPKPK